MEGNYEVSEEIDLREALVKRETNETKIEVKLNLDGQGVSKTSTGIGFFDHMLELFAKQGLFDLQVSVKGDFGVDDHHSVEDIGITLGLAFKQALGEKRGIQRYGFFELPMDETLARAVVDLSGRSYPVFRADFKREKVGELSTELVEHFFESFAKACECNLHLEIIYGKNEHHKIEALFKAFARATRMACAIDERAPNALPSTKGRI